MFRFDPFSAETDADPFPAYRRLREEFPCFWSEEANMWVLSRFADIVAALNDWGRYSSAKGNMMTELPNRAGATLGTTDPPRHDRLRALDPIRLRQAQPRLADRADPRHRPRSGGSPARPQALRLHRRLQLQVHGPGAVRRARPAARRRGDGAAERGDDGAVRPGHPRQGAASTSPPTNGCRPMRRR